MSHAEIIRSGLAKLKGGERWTQGTLMMSHGEQEHFCIIGSMISDFQTPVDPQIIELEPVLKYISDTIAEQFPDQVVTFEDVVHTECLNGDSDKCCPCNAVTLTVSSFNDGRNRQLEDIERVMEKSILKAEEVL